ncbi:MAG: hypothetical protein KatS3mg091_175 [Patescibacteria group bacterium]|nr:MAG: hypothetical protein KatS3mg091_175 [Patescibacteria group bacterium]
MRKIIFILFLIFAVGFAAFYFIAIRQAKINKPEQDKINYAPEKE